MTPEYSPYQKKVIQRYYEHLDGIVLQKLQELVTELYLAKNTPQEDKLWERVENALRKLKIKPDLVAHLLQKRRAELLADHLKDWLQKK